jgi:hypothetical protein
MAAKDRMCRRSDQLAWWQMGRVDMTEAAGVRPRAAMRKGSRLAFFETNGYVETAI